eukprot:1112054-Rhodomonas_salina.1
MSSVIHPHASLDSALDIFPKPPPRPRPRPKATRVCRHRDLVRPPSADFDLDLSEELPANTQTMAV